MAEIGAWRIEGSYFESCNCDAICPCRRKNGAPGGRSTYGICQFVLSWRILKGQGAGVDLSNVLVSMVGFYDNDEAGSPWSVILYVDERASDRQLDVLKEIFLGRAGGNILFASLTLKVLGVKRARIEVDHTPGHERIRVEDFASANAERKAEFDGTITCAIPGHDHPGQEWVSNLAAHDASLQWRYEGRCGFATNFDYFR
jgi:hypothetical protein